MSEKIRAIGGIGAIRVIGVDWRGSEVSEGLEGVRVIVEDDPLRLSWIA